MSESERLALELERALDGEAWHGPSWREALEGVDRVAAVRRPIPGAHTIAEIVAHTTVWLDTVRRRMEGETPQVPDAEDWRETVPVDEDAWRALVAESMARGCALVAVVRGFPAERLQEPRLPIESTWYELVSGELQHVIYHAGQVAVLRKSAG